MQGYDADILNETTLHVPTTNLLGKKDKIGIWNKMRSNSLPYLLVLPAVSISIIFMIIPIIYMAYLSFFKWNMIGSKEFIGLENYATLFADKEFIEVLGNTCKFTIWTVLGFIILGLIFALYLNRSTRINRMIQAIVFVPYIVPLVSIAFIWMWIMDSDIGLLNYILNIFGIDSVKWLQDPKVAIYSLIIINIWKGVGYYALIFLSALQSIPKYLYEAAALDKSSKFTTFFKITLPMLSPTLFFLTLTGTIASFKVFETISIITQGGPVNSTNTLVYYIYQYGFSFYKIGYASAIGMVLMAIVAVLTIIYFIAFSKKVHY